MACKQYFATCVVMTISAKSDYTLTSLSPHSKKTPKNKQKIIQFEVCKLSYSGNIFNNLFNTNSQDKCF